MVLLGPHRHVDGGVVVPGQRDAEPVPGRRSNGYKQYGVAHLVRVLRIKRLTELGFSLSRIAAMGDADDHPEDALRTLDAELAATTERLRRARVELGLILRRAIPTDLPPELAPAAGADLSDADRSFTVVLSRVLGPRGLQVWADLLRNLPADPAADAFDDLPADADDATRQDVAERLVPHARALREGHGGLRSAVADAPRGARFTVRTVDRAVEDVYNAAQRDVLRRLQALLPASPGRAAPGPGSPGPASPDPGGT